MPSITSTRPSHASPARTYPCPMRPISKNWRCPMPMRWSPQQRLCSMSEHEHHHHNHHGETHPHQLEPPHEVFHDPKAGEVVRGWITGGGLSLSLHAMAFGKAEV